MTTIKTLSGFVLAGIILMGCDSGDSGDSSSPSIGDVGTTIRTNSKGTDAGDYSETFSITTRFVATVSDPQGLDDIVLAEIIYPSGNKSTIHNTDTDTLDNINDDGVLISSNYYTNEHVDTRDIQAQTLRLVDSDGNERTLKYSTSLLEPNESSGKSFVYSPSFSGDTSDGYPGLDVADNIGGTINSGAQSVTAEFELNDDRIEGVWVYLCKPDGDDIEYFGSKSFELSEINLDGTANSKNLNWADVHYDDYTFFSEYEGTGAGIEVYAYSGSLSDNGELEDHPVFSSLTGCVPL